VLAAVFHGKPIAGVKGLGVLALLTLTMLVIPVYIFRAFRVVYAFSRVRASVVTIVLVGAFAGLLLAYRGLLFFTTYYTL
jgi:hypothetical protein